MAAFSVSIPLHLALALWLSMQVRQEGPAAEPAVLGEIGTVEAPEAQPEATSPPATQQAVRPIPMPAEPTVAADPAWQRMVESATAEPLAAGGGEIAPAALTAVGSVASGAAAPAAGTSFFGVRAKGLRFAFVVDKSASMNHDGRMRRAVDELVRSTDGLPDYALFRVCLFDTRVASFPERGYRKAREADLAQFRAWLGAVAAGGGTTPRVAFEALLQDGAAPDAIFFMTDGEIGGDEPEWIIQRVRMNGRSIPVHCVALGDPAAIRQLEGIAAATGGKFRFIPGGGMP
ncbi:MAG: hypothetical protein EBQ99_10195 [Planctomycetes bacterium]|nr:hypothetical protein [Planctomycetota bacterium]